MKTKPARHRVQDLGKACDAMMARAHLRKSVETYLEWQAIQADAVEDGDTGLASSIGRNMRALRESFEQWRWDCELEAQES